MDDLTVVINSHLVMFPLSELILLGLEELVKLRHFQFSRYCSTQ